MDNNYPVIYKTYGFVVWYLKKVEKLPKNHRFTLGEKIQSSSLELLLLFSEIVYSKNKKEYLPKINKELEKLRILTRLCVDLGLLSQENQIFIFENVNDIGTQASGWLRNAR